MGWTRRSVAFSVLLAMETQRKQMAARVVRLRDERGWTNETLAYRAGLSVKTVSRLTNAKHDPREETVRKIAKALKVPETALRGEPQPPVTNGDGAGVEALLEEVIRRLDRIEAGQIPDRARQALLKLADAADPEGRGRGKRRELPPGPSGRDDRKPGAEGGAQ